MTFAEAVGRIFAYEGITGDGRGRRTFYIVRMSWAKKPSAIIIDLENSLVVGLPHLLVEPIPPGWKEILPPS